jgi:hypothetical protein
VGGCGQGDYGCADVRLTFLLRIRGGCTSAEGVSELNGSITTIFNLLIGVLGYFPLSPKADGYGGSA